MPGRIQLGNSDGLQDAVVGELGIPCPRCGRLETVVVSMGDPQGPERVVHETTRVKITEMSGITFASCRRCRHSWEMESA